MIFLGGRQYFSAWLPFILPFVFIVVYSSASSDDGKKNAVSVLFQDISISDWDVGNKTFLLRESTLDSVNLYCSRNPSQCSLNFWNESRKFSTKNVVVLESPKQEDNDVVVQLFVALPDGNDIRKDGHSLIPVAVLRKILEDHKSSISSAMGVEIKSIKMNTESDEGSSDNKLNYIMIPISFAVLVVLCLVACCLHCTSKRRQKAINTERRKQALKKLRENISKPSTASNNEGRVRTENIERENVSITVTHENTRRKKKKKNKTEDVYVNDDHQGQFENDASPNLARKRKKKAKHSKETSTLAPAVYGGQLGEGDRERVPTPMPALRGLSTRAGPGESFQEESRDWRRHKKKKKQKRAHLEIREQDEGFDEGSEARQTRNSEDSLIKSLPRPRQLIPLQERSPATLQL